MDAQAMTELSMAEGQLLALSAGGWLSCGVLIGALYFGALRWSVSLFIAGGGPLWPMMIQLARLVFVAGALATVVAGFGAIPLLMASIGILVALIGTLTMGARA
jgi:N-ATPase, AtpR subunit